MTLPPGAGTLTTPGLARRLASFVYEGVLLFGVVMAAGYVYAVLTGQRHALAGKAGLQGVLFVVLGTYFIWFWSRNGQTLAMQTWSVRLVRRDGSAVGWRRAGCRFLLAWLWFMPALATLHLTGLHSGWEAAALVTVGVLAYAALARLHPDRQYLHDVVCGTRLVVWRAGGKETRS